MAKIDDAPKSGDRADLRCAFIQRGCTTFVPMTDAQWCDGCGHYVCEKCDTREPPFPYRTHHVAEHIAYTEDAGRKNEEEW